MTEFRRDPLIRRWVVTGFAQSEHPNDVVTGVAKEDQAGCPFCEGNEYRTPPETYALRKSGAQPNGPGWSLRVVPNRSTDMRVAELNKRGQGGVYDLQDASGIHETVVETPKHVERFSALSAPQIADVLKTFQLRNEEHFKNHLLKGILFFRNQGKGGAGVFEHTHSQIVSLPFIPKTVSDEMSGARQYFDMKHRCIFCDMVVEETRMARRVVYESSAYLAWCPFASRFPYEVWVAPKFHQSEYRRADSNSFLELAKMLKDVLQRIEKVVGDSPLSFVLHTAPLRSEGLEDASWVERAYHWHIEILPHAVPAGGFEWGGDFYLSPPTPETCAAILAKTTIDDQAD